MLARELTHPFALLSRLGVARDRIAPGLIHLRWD